MKKKIVSFAYQDVEWTNINHLVLIYCLVLVYWSAYNDISAMLTWSSDKVWMVIIIVCV